MNKTDMLEADAQQSDQITGLQVAIRNLTEQPAAPQEPYELDQCDVERAKRCLEALRVVLGIDSPETRGWAPIVQQEARRAIDRALAALVEQTAQIQRLKSSVPQEPVAYLAWRDGKPCWEGDDCVCEDAVYPVDHDDDRTSMPVYLAPQPQRPRLTDDEIVEWTDAVIRKEAFNRPIAIEIAKQAARWAEKKVRGEA